MKSLTASNLKAALWETLAGLRENSMQPNQADAIASQAREILRTIKVQLQISQQTKRAVPVDVISFSENSEK